MKKKDLIFFIHGLGGSPKGTWEKFPELIAQDVDLKDKMETRLYSYPTSFFNVPFLKKAPRIQDVALGIKTELEVNIEQYDRVFLVCHSLGGLIAKKFLMDNFENIDRLKIRGILLYAVPNNGADIAKFGKYISWKNYQLRQLCKDSDFIDLTNEQWAKIKIEDKLYVRYAIAGQDAVVDIRSAKAYWGNEKIDYLPNVDHIGIVKPNSADHLSYKIFKKFYDKNQNEQNVIEQYLKKVVSNVGSFKLPLIELSMDIESAWIPLNTTDPRKESFFEEDDLELFIKKYHSQGKDRSYKSSSFEVSEIFDYSNDNIIVGIPGAGKSTLIKKLCYELAKQNKIVVAFRLPHVVSKMINGESFRAALLSIVSETFEYSRQNAQKVISAAEYFIFDGLDECRDMFQEVSIGIQEFRSENRNRKFAVTTRPIGYKKYLFEEWKHYEIDMLGENELKNFSEKVFEKLFVDSPQKIDEMRSQFKKNLDSNHVVSIAVRNPLLLSFVISASVHNKKIGSYRNDLYKTVLDLSLEFGTNRLDANAKTYTDSYLLTVIYLIGFQIREAVVEKKESIILSTSELISKIFKESSPNAHNIAEECVKIWIGKGVLDSFKNGDAEYVTFVHLSISEYCAAKHLESCLENELIAWIDKKKLDAKWHETLIMLAGTKYRDASVNQISKNIKGESIIHDFYLTTVCLKALNESRAISQEVVDAVLSKAKDMILKQITSVSLKTFLLLARLNTTYSDVLLKIVNDLENVDEIVRLGKILICLEHSDERVLKDVNNEEFYAYCLNLSSFSKSKFFVIDAPFSEFKRMLIIAVTRNFLKNERYSLLKAMSFEHLSLNTISNLGELFTEFGQKELYNSLYENQSKSYLKGLWNFDEQFENDKKSDVVYLALIDGILTSMMIEEVQPDKPLYELRKLASVLRLAECPAFEGGLLHRLPQEEVTSVKEVLKGVILCADIDLGKLKADVRIQIQAHNRLAEEERRNYDHIVSPVESKCSYDKAAQIDINDELVVLGIDSQLSYVRLAAIQIFYKRCIGREELLSLLKDKLVEFSFGTEYVFKILTELYGEKSLDIAYEKISLGEDEYSCCIYDELSDYSTNLEDEKVIELLEKGIFSKHQKNAISAVSYFHKVRPNEYFIQILQSCYNYWEKNEKPYPAESGVIIETPRIAILKALLLVRKFSGDELLHYVSEEWSGFAEIVLPEIDKLISADEQVIEKIINDLISKKIKIKVFHKIVSFSKEALKNKQSFFQKLWESNVEELQIVYLDCLKDLSPSLGETESFLKKIVDNKSNSTKLRDAAYRAMKNLE